MPDPHYQRHVFFCVNRREDGRRCCADNDSEGCREYAKQRMKAADCHGRGMVRINRCGCLDRCDEGPVMVVYPEGVWYTYVDREDIDEIIDQHLLKGKIVKRLRI
ncbi:MAG: (2Fe-2S) ferredoxin domain-containing protein [Gammaproteobacteria bacterium]|nr:(2Fe-2S) ferredoxin domain-containing protein [Gammaproteobacteria bacterium]MDD9875718.1 (2Fe-2S) ferredoxin domain-containing protein [Gammaproteobacteria bacterium]